MVLMVINNLHNGRVVRRNHYGSGQTNSIDGGPRDVRWQQFCGKNTGLGQSRPLRAIDYPVATVGSRLLAADNFQVQELMIIGGDHQ